MTKPLPREQLRRQPKGERRTTGYLAVRWTKLEAELVRLAAQARGLDASEAVRAASLAWAREVLGSTDPPAGGE